MATPPWNANEKWTFGTLPNGKRFARVTGRTLAPESLKSDPTWWLRNDYEQSADEAPWFMTGAPEWLRQAAWITRNPLQNGNAFVWGVADRNFTVTVDEGNPDPLVIQRNDVLINGQPDQGWQRSTLTLEDGTIKKWCSYCSGHFVSNWGWQPFGNFETKVNL
jgi:hypothetical protein